MFGVHNSSINSGSNPYKKKMNSTVGIAGIERLHVGRKARYA